MRKSIFSASLVRLESYKSCKIKLQNEDIQNLYCLAGKLSSRPPLSTVYGQAGAAVIGRDRRKQRPITAETPYVQATGYLGYGG